jgi:colanic acid/amylovoran biosynthesis glycosyltransferase
MTHRIRALIVSTKFPNTIQPWLANSTAQIVKHGGSAEIFSIESGDKIYAAVVDEYQLKNNTTNLNFYGRKILIAIANNFLNPRNIFKSIRGAFIAPKYLSKHKSFSSNLVGTLVLAPHFIKKNIDIIHSHFEITGHKFLPAARAQQVPFIVTFHGLPPPGVTQLPKKMRAEYVEAADVILVNTEFAKKQYVHLGAPAEKIKIIPQGVATKNFAFTAKPLPIDAPVELLSVGRFHADKGHKYVLQALPELIRRGYHLHYTLVGTGPDRGQLEKMVAELHLQHVVSFHTTISEQKLKKIYASAHIFIFPSLKATDGFHEETQGVAIQEAQASGLIVISTKTGGIPECVEDGKSAFLVDDRNSAAIADKIRWIIDNPQQWHEWQHNARKHVETYFDIDVIGNQLMQIYADTITQFHNNYAGTTDAKK